MITLLHNYHMLQSRVTLAAVAPSALFLDLAHDIATPRGTYYHTLRRWLDLFYTFQSYCAEKLDFL